MSESDGECIFVERRAPNVMDLDYDNALDSLTDCESIVTDDSSFSIVSRSNNDCPSLTTACQAGGEPLEQRTDIIETKEIPVKLKKLTFKDEQTTVEVYDRVRARESLDRDIENEIKNIINVENNEQLTMEKLKKAARIARENMEVARKTASDGQTTVKRAMEVIENAFPVFLEACNKSYEENKLDEEVTRQLRYYEECQRAEKQAAYDIDVRQQRESQASEHLGLCIDLAEKDVKKISEKTFNEESQDRLSSFKAVKKEIEDIISGEFEEVDGWLISCKDDLETIASLQREQENRFSDATKSFETMDKNFDMKLTLNKNRQDELLRQLNALKVEQRKLTEDQAFQKEVQSRAKFLHGEVCNQLSELQRSISGIQNRAITSQKVMESMTICGNELLDASLSAEKSYIEQLKELETEAMTRCRFALATSAVEKKMAIENSFENILDYKERMKFLQEDLKKAVQRNQRLVAEKTKDSLKEFNNEKKKEQDKKKEAEECLESLMEKLKTIDEELVKRGVEIESVDMLHDIRKQEMEISLAEGYSSLELSDVENNEDD